MARRGAASVRAGVRAVCVMGGWKGHGEGQLKDVRSGLCWMVRGGGWGGVRRVVVYLLD